MSDPSLYPGLNAIHLRKKKSQTEKLDISNYPSQRFKFDFALTFVVMILVFVAHISTVLDRLYIVGLYVFAAICCFTGLTIRLLVPALRKPHPFRIFIRPFLENKEHRMFEPPNRPGQVMWFEKAFLVLSILETSFFYPVLYLIAFAGEGPQFIEKFGLQLINSHQQFYF